MRFEGEPTATVFVLGATSTIFEGPDQQLYARSALPGADANDRCMTFSVESSDISLNLFKDQLEGFAPFGGAACPAGTLPFRATWTPPGLQPAFERGSAPLAPGEDGHEFPGGVFHVRGSKPGRQIEIYRAEPAWWPTSHRELISILGRHGWLGTSVNTQNVDFLDSPFGGSCDYYSIVSLGVTRPDLKRFAEGLQLQA